MGKSTISMVMFPVRYVSHYQRVNPIQSHEKPAVSYGFPKVFTLHPQERPKGKATGHLRVLTHRKTMAFTRDLA